MRRKTLPDVVGGMMCGVLTPGPDDGGSAGIRLVSD